MKIDLSMGQLYRYSLNFFGKHTRLNDQQKRLLEEAMHTMEPVIKENRSKEEIAEAYRKLTGQMDDIDRVMGGGTYYGKLFREMNMTRPMNYQEAQADFKTSLKKEGLTNAYGRYFADYMGIAAGFLTVFISGFIFTRDRKYRMHELINSRPVSSLTYVAAKFLAVTLVAFACILVPATHATVVFIRISQMYSYQIDYFAFYKYALTWILPTIMFSNAFGMLLSVIFDNGIIPVLAQVSLWSTSLNYIVVDYSLLRPVIRFNTVGDYYVYQQYKEAIIANRVFYALLSLSLIFLTSLIWSWRRCSSYEGVKLLKYIKIQYKNYIQH
jgi:ABC-type transport system involved in multi-copper enzyme maturation permease subunit